MARTPARVGMHSHPTPNTDLCFRLPTVYSIPSPGVLLPPPPPQRACTPLLQSIPSSRKGDGEITTWKRYCPSRRRAILAAPAPASALRLQQCTWTAVLLLVKEHLLPLLRYVNAEPSSGRGGFEFRKRRLACWRHPTHGTHVLVTGGSSSCEQHLLPCFHGVPRYRGCNVVHHDSIRCVR